MDNKTFMILKDMMEKIPPAFKVRFKVLPEVAREEADCIVFLNNQRQLEFLTEVMDKHFKREIDNADGGK